MNDRADTALFGTDGIVCCICNKEKSPTEFYKNKHRPNGLQAFCKICNKERCRVYYASGKFARYYSTEQGRAKRRAYNQRTWERFPERRKALQLMQSAIRHGRLFRGPCEVCGNMRVDGHHEDYSKPLEVRWLCRKHHREEHAKWINQTNNA